MPNDAITRYSVDRLVEARKVAMRAKRNTLYSADPKLFEHELRVPLRRVDCPTVDLVLEFYGRVKTKGLPGVASNQKPSASMIWHGKRIRGLDHALRHDVVQNGIVTGFIRGWHEHFWTDADEDSSIREPSPPIKNFDLQSVVKWCSTNWNIEDIALRSELFQ
jgi:hypothetical protein